MPRALRNWNQLGRQLALIVLVTAACSHDATAQDTTVEAGRRVYREACASCHGDSADGYGPAAHVLRQRPTDLTRFSSRTTPFPREVLRNTITGRIRLEPSHGTSDMPVWRTSLNQATPGAPGVTAIDALLTYLDTMQLRPFGPYQGPSAAEMAASGSGLYQLHCAPCHGADGRGPVQGRYVVGAAPPDLGTLAARQGRFDLGEVKERIARGNTRDDAMPAIDGMLLREGWHPAIVTWQIDRIARFLQSIQRK